MLSTAIGSTLFQILFLHFTSKSAGNAGSRWTRKAALGVQVYLHLLEGILNKPCYKYLEEILCYTFHPKCETNEFIVPCRESCFELIEGCYEDVLFLLRNITVTQVDVKDLGINMMEHSNNMRQVIGCDYLPLANDSVPCQYKPVTCGTPPNVKNGAMQGFINATTDYPLHSEVDYLCKTESFRIEGNSTIKCMYSGQWSEPPRCLKQPESVSTLIIVLPVLIMPFIIYLAIIIFYKCKNRPETSSVSRNRQFDAYVCYDFDGDNDFVLNTILPE